MKIILVNTLINIYKKAELILYYFFQTEIEPTGSSISYLADKTQNNITATYLGRTIHSQIKRLIFLLPYVNGDVLLLQVKLI